MQFRSLLVMGLCAALGVAVPARAEAPPPAKKVFLFSSSKAADDAAPAKSGQKNKKMTAKEKAKAAALAKAAAKEEAKAKTKAEKLAAKAKADAAKKVADAKKAAEAAKLAKAKALADAKALKAKALADAKVAKAKAAQADKLAKAKALADAKLAKAKAAEQQRLAAEKAREQELVQYASMPIAKEGNNGELRSETVDTKPAGFFDALFGGPVAKASLLPETKALDAALELKKKKFTPRPEFMPQDVTFTGYPAGTIVIDTDNHFLYLVQSFSSARRYGIAVGKDGLQYKGTVAVGDKQEWPRWIPTKEMQQRDPKKYGRYKDGMPGGGQNPLGARAIYLYDGKKDTHLRIHGTIAPESIGTNSSNGCFRMINEHVMDLYRRVKVGTKVVVL